MNKVTYVRLNNKVITRVLDGYTPSHDRGSCGGWYKNKILTEWDVDHDVNEPHKDYSTQLLKYKDIIVLNADGMTYKVRDAAGTFMEIMPYNEENPDAWYTPVRKKYTNSKGELTFTVKELVEPDRMTTLDGVDLSEEDMYNYECFKKLINQYYPDGKAQNGIAKNFLKWRENKSRLIELFRKHPNWNEREKAIIIDTAEFKRNFSKTEARDALTLFKNDVYNTYRHYTYNEWKSITPIFGYLHDLIFYGTKTVHDANTSFVIANDEGKRYLSYIYDDMKDISSDAENPYIENQKISKTFAKVFRGVGLDNAECYNRDFAKLSDALSAKAMPAKLVFSLNICDYVTMSHGNSWTSCHSFEHKGGWHAGSISYAMDDVTIVAYGLPVGGENNDLFKERKIFRQLFMLSNDNKSFCQSRMYPAENLYNPDMIHTYFVNAINACTGEYGKYELNMDRVRLESGAQSLQYRDYTRVGNYSCYGADNTITIGASCYDFRIPTNTLTNTGRIYYDTYEHIQPVIYASNEVSETTAA